MAGRHITTIAATQLLVDLMITVLLTEGDGIMAIGEGEGEAHAGSRGVTRSGATPKTPVGIGTGAGQNGIIVTRLRLDPILRLLEGNWLQWNPVGVQERG